MPPLKTLVLVTWPIVLWAAVLYSFGGIGFNPTDEGFVNAVSWRLLDGQVPHADFIWPRPTGSGYLHIPELLLPTPLVLSARAIALAEVIGYSLLFAMLILDRPPTRWSIVEAIGVGAAALANLNAFPLMAWYTIDGLLFVSAGAVLLRSALRRASVKLVAAAFLAFGIAALTKQSFWPAPIFGMIWLLAATPKPQLRLRLAGPALVAALVPAVAYTGLVTAGGGLGTMAAQLTSAEPLLGDWLIEALAAPAVYGPVLAGVVALICLSWLGHYWPIRLMAQVFFGAIVLGVVSDGDLEIENTWAIVLFWLVVARAEIELLAGRGIDWTALVLIGVGWMASLSFGISTPNLVAGSMALFLLVRVLDLPVSMPRRREVTLAAAAIVVLALIVPPMSASARTEMVYRDRQAHQLTMDLGAIHPDLEGVRGTPVTAQYLSELVDCVAAHPASRVAVVPDNPVIYPMLELQNPLPIDWMIPADMIGSEERVLAAARETDRAGDYLVLFQTRDARDLPKIDALSSDRDGGFRDAVFGERLLASFSGEPVECGVFRGFWKPGSSAL